LIDQGPFINITFTEGFCLGEGGFSMPPKEQSNCNGDDMISTLQIKLANSDTRKYVNEHNKTQ